jgi:hypothetical protein
MTARDILIEELRAKGADGVLYEEHEGRCACSIADIEIGDYCNLIMGCAPAKHVQPGTQKCRNVCAVIGCTDKCYGCRGCFVPLEEAKP